MKNKLMTLLLCAFTTRSAFAGDLSGYDRINIGSGNSLGGTYSSITGGSANTTAPDYSVISGGQNNTISGTDRFDAISGGLYNSIDAARECVISGGSYNTIHEDSYGSAISGGIGNTIFDNATYTAISGGTLGVIGPNSSWSWIGGGWGNVISNDNVYCAIGGGTANTINSNNYQSVIGGGNDHIIYANSAHGTIAGGAHNIISNMSPGCILGGGAYNIVKSNSPCAIIGGGQFNTIGNNASYSIIIGGTIGTIGDGGEESVILGGKYNQCVTKYSLAAGFASVAQYGGSFVWSDHSSESSTVYSSVPNQFVVAASGGIWLGTRTAAASSTAMNGHFIETSTGGYLTTAGVWTSTSDRNLKRDFRELSSKDVLEKVVSLPVTSWGYKAEDESVRHIGPMAQDFYATFNLGQDDRHIASIDEGGVALAAIQGLYQLAKEKDEQIHDLQKQVSSLKKQVAAQEHVNARWEERFIALEKVVSRKSPSVLTVSNIRENR